jgi:transcription elongation factor Elf1
VEQLTENEIIVLKQIVKNVKHKYTRGFQCTNCGYVSKKSFTLHDAITKNNFGNMVCTQCGSSTLWEDIKIKTIWCNISKINGLRIIEKVGD